MTHTPGPWTFDGITYIWGPNNEMIADLPDECRVARIRGVGGRLPIDANAQLLSTAPELLEACEGFTKLMDQILPQIGGLSLDLGLLNETLMLSDKAISKARAEVNGDGPEFEDGPWAKGWKERAGLKDHDTRTEGSKWEPCDGYNGYEDLMSCASCRHIGLKMNEKPCSLCNDKQKGEAQ